jgi:hypothetical protein
MVLRLGEGGGGRLELAKTNPPEVGCYTSVRWILYLEIQKFFDVTNDTV